MLKILEEIRGPCLLPVATVHHNLLKEQLQYKSILG